jgi:uncharacterized C2H2 Zn-finger protein
MAEYVTHCPKCGQIFIDDEDFEGKCPFCGYLFETED